MRRAMLEISMKDTTCKECPEKVELYGQPHGSYGYRCPRIDKVVFYASNNPGGCIDFPNERPPACPLKIVPETPEGELKPCPFCGGKAKNYSRYSNIGRLLHFAGCEACSAEASHREDMEQAIAAWNRRDGNA